MSTMTALDYAPVPRTTPESFTVAWLDLIVEAAQATDDAKPGSIEHRVAVATEHAVRHAAAVCTTPALLAAHRDTCDLCVDLSRVTCAGCETCRPEAVAA